MPAQSRNVATVSRQRVGLLLQALGRGGGLFHQRGVLLRHLVELRHRVADLADAARSARRSRR